MSSYEETVMLPVANYLDVCATSSSTPGSNDDADTTTSTSTSTIIDAIDSITCNLDCATADIGGDAFGHWAQFLRGSGDDDDSPEVQVRDELLASLVASCAEYDNSGGGRSGSSSSNDNDRGSNAQLKLRTAAFRCLHSILLLRTDPVFDGSIKRGDGDCSLVGSRLVDLAPSILSTYAHGTSADDAKSCIEAATDVVRRLLPPHCPREECPPAQIRDVVLVPLSDSTATAASREAVATAAMLIQECVVKSARQASSYVGSGTDADDEEMRSLKMESAVLAMMQQMRPVLGNLIEQYDDAGDVDGITEPDMVLQMAETMYKLAPHAVESQINDGKGGPGSIIMTRIVGTVVKPGGDDSPEDAAAAACTKTEVLTAGAGVSHDETGLTPFYANLTDPPIEISTAKQLDSTLNSIQEDLVMGEDSEMWNLRFDALKTLERILAGGIIRSDDLRPTFLATVRKMPIEKQILDLRSQITRQACRFLTAFAYELRENGQQECFVAMANFAELWTPAVLKLSISGVKLMATQGMNCVMHLAALGGTYGYPRVVPTLCNGCVGKVHQNHRRGCILALTAALRVWGGQSLERHADAIGKAVSESVCHRDPNVREEGRKSFWALHAREGFRHIAENLLSRMDSREMKRLNAAKAETDAEWEKGGRLEIMVRTGVDIGSSPKAGAAKPTSGRSRGTKGRAVSKKKVASNSSTRPSIKERMKASAMAKSRPTAGDSDDIVVKSEAPFSRPIALSAVTSTPGRARKATRSALASTSKAHVSANPTPSTASKQISGRTPRKPAVPKQNRASTLRPTTPGRVPASVAKSARKKRMLGTTPGRSTSLATPSKYKYTPSRASTTPSRFTPSMQRGVRSIDDFVQMANAAQWSQREKAFVTLTALMEQDLSAKSSGRRKSIDRSFNFASYISSSSKVEQFVASLLDNMKERNVRVCRSATLCCSVCLRHDEMRAAIGPFVQLILPTIFNVLAKYDKGGAATENVSDAASDCLDYIARYTEQNETLRLFSLSLGNHNKTSGSDSHSYMTDGAIQQLVDMFCNAICDFSVNDCPMPPVDIALLFKHLANIISRPSNRYAGTPQHMTRAADDKLKASVCMLSKLVLEGNNAERIVQVFLMMEQEDVDPLISCIWTFGGHWGDTLRATVVKAVWSQSTTTSSNVVIMEGTFGEGLSDKPTSEQADLFSDLLSPKPKARTPENDPLKALVEVATPKTPALPCNIGTRLLGVGSTPSTSTTSSSDSTSIPTTFKSPLVPKRLLNVDAKTPDPRVDVPLEARTPMQMNGSDVSPVPRENEAKTPATKTPFTSTSTVYTPYEKAMRSLKKGKTPKLEFSPPPQAAAIPTAMKFKGRPSSMSPIITDTLSEEDVEALPEIVDGLKNSTTPQEQYVMLQSLLRHAKSNSNDGHWVAEFGGILECLLAGCGTETEQECVASGPLTQLPTNTQDSAAIDTLTIAKPVTSDETEVDPPAKTAAASRCLYLQGIRALIKYVPHYFQKDHVEVVIDKLLEYSTCSASTTYEQVHTAERALENMAESFDPLQCMDALSKHVWKPDTATAESSSMSSENAAVVLLTLRALSKLMCRITKDDARKALPSLKPMISESLSSRQVDMRKAAVFLIVEMHASLGDDVLSELGSISPAQQKLVSIYISRRSKEAEKGEA